MAKKFLTGFVTGSVAAIGAVAASAYAFKKTVIEPTEERAQQIEENRRRANRKSHQAHMG
ncbi:DUF3042 family protein [Xylocopilactobacillus apis]|uniref:DUF3042 domain-containing protein n=1 Tax=Xylocopilactobacillus apis TaxID=2932183 RepID=A0AAU9D4H8_9LACO|nr:DUF3042 family protein [Xylocopilactobacillus apis]BDR56320.1 DUF3042 domain-containing protein [Xylocopilactobacillus apis]